MFLIVTAILFGGIMALALGSIRFLVSEHLAKKFYRLFALADLAILVVIIVGWSMRSFVPEWFVAFFGNAATIFLMAQLLCGALVICAVVFRWLWRKFNPPKPCCH